MSVVCAHTPSQLTPNTCPHNPACSHFRYGTANSMCGFLGQGYCLSATKDSPSFSLLSVMHFDHLLFVFLYAFMAHRGAVARKVKVNRFHTGIDEFEVLDDNMNSICTETERALEFCAEHGAINVQNRGSCSNNEETLQCRCNSTKSTFLVHEGRCVNNHNITRLLQGEMPSGKRTKGIFSSCHTDIPYCFMRVIIYFIVLFHHIGRIDHNEMIARTC